eukprot:1138494-Pelagomonas_calceolata.AAC.1
MITKALSKTPWGAGLVNTNIGNDTRLAQHNLQIAAYASNRTSPSSSLVTFLCEIDPPPADQMLS